MIITLLIVLSIIVYSLLKWNGKIRTPQTSIFYNTKLVRIALIFTIIIGYWGSLDYNAEWGCIHHEFTFQKYEIYLSTLSLLIISIAAFVRSNRLKLALHVAEAFYWISKLILFKGGYVVGIFGMPDDINLLFDFTGIVLRFIIIRNLAFNMRKAYILMISFALVMIKCFIFPVPMSLKWEHQIQRKAKQDTWNKLQGKWLGQKFYESRTADTLYPKHVDSAKMTLLDAIHSKDPLIKTTVKEKIDQVSVWVDSNVVQIKSGKLETNYILDLANNSSGDLYEILPDTAKCDTSLMDRLKTKHKIRRDNENHRWIAVQKLEQDSLVFTAVHNFIMYRLKRVR